MARDELDEQVDHHPPPDRRITASERAAVMDVSPSILFGVLADSRERRILYFLVENGGKYTLEEIGKYIAAWENDTTLELLTEEMENRVSAGMYHADIPKLEDYGFIEFESETGQITLTEQTKEIIPMLKFAEQLEGMDFEEYLEQVHQERMQSTERER